IAQLHQISSRRQGSQTNVWNSAGADKGGAAGVSSGARTNRTGAFAYDGYIIRARKNVRQTCIGKQPVKLVTSLFHKPASIQSRGHAPRSSADVRNDATLNSQETVAGVGAQHNFPVRQIRRNVHLKISNSARLQVAEDVCARKGEWRNRNGKASADA